MFGNQENKARNVNADYSYFSVYDTKVGFYNNPFIAMNEEEVLRDFKNMMSDPEQRKTNKYYLNSEDFQIFKLASWDKKTGSINSYSPQHVANLHEIRSLADRKSNAPLIEAQNLSN